MAWFETSLAANASLPAINIIHSGYNLQLNKSLCQLLPAEKKNGANNKTILREQEEQ